MTSVPPSTLRLSGSLLPAGVVVQLVSGLFHADSANANDHPAIFAVYAASSVWISGHLGQFVGMATRPWDSPRPEVRGRM